MVIDLVEIPDENCDNINLNRLRWIIRSLELGSNPLPFHFVGTILKIHTFVQIVQLVRLIFCLMFHIDYLVYMFEEHFLEERTEH